MLDDFFLPKRPVLRSLDSVGSLSSHGLKYWLTLEGSPYPKLKLIVPCPLTSVKQRFVRVNFAGPWTTTRGLGALKRKAL